MFRKILGIFLILVVVLIIVFAFVFRNKTQKLINYIKPGGSGQVTGEGSKNYQISVVNITKGSVPKVVDLNSHWLRTQIRWDAVEPKRGQFNWSELDNAALQAEKYNIGLTLIIYTGQGWGTKCDPAIAPLNSKTHCPPVDLTSTWSSDYGYSQNYYHFVNELAARYKGKIDQFIIHNEVNTLRFWHGTPEQYLELRKTAYKAIHDVNPNAIVIDNSLASPVWGAAIISDLLDQGKDQEAVDFFNRFFYRGENFTKVNSRADILQAASKREEWSRAVEFAHTVFIEPTFDWAGFHYYEPEDTFLDVVAYVNAQMKKNGYQKPIAMTEGGYSDNTSSLIDKKTQEQVAIDLVKMNLEAFGEGLKMFVWLPIEEVRLSGDTFNEKLKGLFNTSGKILPAGNSWKYLNSQIGPDTKISNESRNDFFVYRLETDGQNILVMWSKNEKTIKASDYGKSSFKVVDIFGNTKEENTTEIAVNSTPVYLK